MQIGKFNTLKIVKTLNFGAYLDDGSNTEILLPKRYVPRNAKIGDEVEVFLYHDNEGRIIATTARPYATVGEFKLMRVKDVGKVGAFLDWGIMKDLLVPFHEQKREMKVGEWHLVHVYQDFISKRIVASTRLNKFLDNLPPDYQQNQEVDIIIADKTELGRKVIINNTHWGMIFNNEIFRELSKGEHLKGFIKGIRREDEKIDVSLAPVGYEKIEGTAQHILQTIEKSGGTLPLGDKSNAEEIYQLFSCSKKTFKKAVGALYKQQLITIGDWEIRLQHPKSS